MSCYLKKRGFTVQIPSSYGIRISFESNTLITELIDQYFLNEAPKKFNYFNYLNVKRCQFSYRIASTLLRE